MRKHLQINLSQRTTKVAVLEGEAELSRGRHYIAKTLLAAGIATVDPLSPENPLIFSAGPFAGTNFSNANRISVGCKSPLTGGIKEANSGGTFGNSPRPDRRCRTDAAWGIGGLGGRSRQPRWRSRF